MDFIDEVRQFSARAQSLLPHLKTEEATKHSLILPFMQLLGYNVFSPSEVVPEFTADVGTKKGEKVDYAIMIDGRPAILIEAKPCTDPLTNHDAQLFRYFTSTEAQFAILTNGLVYKFFSDLQETNKMDSEPFLEFSLLDPREPIVAEVKKFHRENFNAEDLFSAASNLQYTTKISRLMDRELREPSDAFLRFVLHDIYPGKIMQGVLDRFRPLVKRALSQYISELIGDRLKSVMQTVDAEKESAAASTDEEDLTAKESEPAPKVVTTVMELEAFYSVKAILREAVEPSRISYKDTTEYFGIILDENPRKWICRLYLNRSKKRVLLPGVGDSCDLTLPIQSVDDLFGHSSALVEAARQVAG